MATKDIKKEKLKKIVEKEIEEEVKEAIEEYDPSLPESKQRHLR